MNEATAPLAAGPPGDPSAWPWIGGLEPAQDPQRETWEFRHALRIGGRWLLIPRATPAEVCAPLPCARLPFTEAWFLGLASFRGDPLPIYDLGALLAERTSGSGGYFLIVGRREARAGLRIDEIAGFPVPPDAAPVPPPQIPGLPDGLVGQGLAVDGIDYAEIDLDALLRALAERASLLPADPLSPQD